MKTLCIGIALLCMLTLACAAIGNPAADPSSKQTTHQSGQASDGQVTTPAPSQSNQRAAILSRTEADSLSIRGDSLLAQSDISDIKVGAPGGYDLIYVLVVILLVVVIVAAVR
jgi:hypothetical protein